MKLTAKDIQELTKDELDYNENDYDPLTEEQELKLLEIYFILFNVMAYISYDIIR